MDLPRLLGVTDLSRPCSGVIGLPQLYSTSMVPEFFLLARVSRCRTARKLPHCLDPAVPLGNCRVILTCCTVRDEEINIKKVKKWLKLIHKSCMIEIIHSVNVCVSFKLPFENPHHPKTLTKWTKKLKSVNFVNVFTRFLC